MGTKHLIFLFFALYLILNKLVIFKQIGKIIITYSAIEIINNAYVAFIFKKKHFEFPLPVTADGIGDIVLSAT